MRVEGLDDLAGAWLFAHLRVAPSPQTGNPTDFEPELLNSHAEAPHRAAKANARAATNLRHPSVLFRVVWRLAARATSRFSMPGLFRAGLAASRLLQAITGPAAVLRSFGATFYRRSSRPMSSQVPILQRRPAACPSVAVGLPLTRQRGNRPGFLPSE